MARESSHGRIDHRRRLGWRGEELAITHFRELGFEVVAHNQHRRVGELDLVVYDGRTLVFVEVKARYISRAAAEHRKYDGETLGWPSIKQLKAHRRTACRWLAERGAKVQGVRDMRLDVVKVLFDEHGELLRLDHLEAASDGVW